MSTALELVYQYRFLMGKCEAGRGLSVDEIDTLNTIEALFGARGRASSDTDLWSCQRKFVREKVCLRARVCNAKVSDFVEVVDLGPGGLVCHEAPAIPTGTTLEIQFEDKELSLSYRFKAEVAWIDRDGEYASLGLTFIGAPLLLRSRPKTTSDTDDNAVTTKFAKVAA